MARDENTYGFRKDDADALIASIGMGESETPGRRFSGGSTSTLFAFALTADMVAKSAAADISNLDGASQTFAEASTVYDPQDIFGTLNDGDTGLCLKQAGKYYIIQANCPDDVIPSSSSSGLTSAQAPEPPLPPE
jgi:hypothetical protein